jgi:hypothetical protein
MSGSERFRISVGREGWYLVIGKIDTVGPLSSRIMSSVHGRGAGTCLAISFKMTGLRMAGRQGFDIEIL